MGSNSGIKDGVFDRLEIIQDLGVGQDQDFGTNGEVLISGGENESLRWGSNSAVLPEKLNKSGSNIVMTKTSDGSVVSYFDGSVETNIASTNTEYLADKGVEINTATSPDTLEANVDGTTINNTGGGGSDELNVLKVPNTITFVNDGSGATTGTFDGSSALTIEVGDTSHSFQADKGVEINTATSPDTIQAKVDDTTPSSQTIQNDFNSDELHVLRVPENLTATLGIEFETGITSYDGSVQTTIETKIDKTSTQTMSNSGGTGNDELNVLKVPNNLTADTKTIIIGGSLTGVFNGGTAQTIGVKKLPHELTIIDGDTTIEFDGSADKSISIVQGSIDHTQVSRQGQTATETITNFPFSTAVPSLTDTNFAPITGWGIESLVARATDYKIETSFQLFSPGSTTTASGTFVRGVIRLDNAVATDSSSAWGVLNGVYSPVYLGGVKITGGVFTFNSAVASSGMSLWDGRVHYTWVISGLTIGNSYNFIPKGVSYNNTTNTRLECSIAYGGIYGFATCSAVPIGINSPVLNVESSSDDY